MTKQIPVGYKQTKVGVIPEDWEVVKFGSIVEPISREIKKPDSAYWRLGLRSHGKGTFHEYIEDPRKVEMKTLYIVHENDLIVNITFAWEHAIAIADHDDHGKLVSHRFPTYKFKNNSNYKYYRYYVLQEKFRLLLENISPGGAGRNRVMSKKNFLELPVILPILKEQEKIAEILSTWDDAIAKQEQLIEQKQVFKKVIMQQLFSQKIRFKDFNGNDYPAWKEIHLSAIVEINPKSESLPDYFYYIDLECVNAGRVGKLDYISSNNAPSRAQRVLSTNDILFQMVRPYQRNNLLFNIISEDNYVASTGYAQLRAKERHSYKFIFQLLLTDDFVKVVMLRCTGTSYPAISSSDLSTIIVNVPKCEEQTKIADFLNSFDDEITKQTEILEQLKLQKQSLMQKLLTGQVRIVI